MVSERQTESASARGCTTASCPGHDFSVRTVASARVPSASVISSTPALAPRMVKGCASPSTSSSRRPFCSVPACDVATMTPSELLSRTRRPKSVVRCKVARSSRLRGVASGLDSPASRSSRSETKSAMVSSSLMDSIMTWRRWSSTCTTAPTPMVRRNAMISAGTARRSAGSAISSRRYAGFAMDCASPLIESERVDALAASARAMPSPRNWIFPVTRDRKDVFIAPESLSIGIDAR
jgi:hypothetical protein